MSYSATLVPTAKVDRSIPTNIVVFIAPPAAVSVLRAVLATVPREFPAAIVFLHHAGEGRERPIAENLNVSPRLLVAPGMVGMPLLNGRGYVLRSDSSLTVGSAGTFVEDTSTTDDRCETILESIAHQWGAGVIAITLTALSLRESAAFRKVREAGGHTIALNEADRLWADSSGPRVVPDPEDELLASHLIGKRIVALLSTTEKV